MTDLQNNQRERDSHSREPITVTVDDVEFDTADDDQEAASLVRLVGRDPEEFDLFVVDEKGVETHVKDEQIVNLRDGGRFRTRRKVRFTIDRERHTSWDDDQTVAALLRLNGVDPTKYDLTRVSDAGNPETFSGDQVVTIHDGDEFVTAEQGKTKTVTIIVNTRPQNWHEREITFEQIVELAFPGQPYDPAGTTVEHSRGHGKDKPLRPGESVRVKEGMIFDVESANRS